MKDVQFLGIFFFCLTDLSSKAGVRLHIGHPEIFLGCPHLPSGGFMLTWGLFFGFW